MVRELRVPLDKNLQWVRMLWNKIYCVCVAFWSQPSKISVKYVKASKPIELLPSEDFPSKTLFGSPEFFLSYSFNLLSCTYFMSFHYWFEGFHTNFSYYTYQCYPTINVIPLSMLSSVSILSLLSMLVCFILVLILELSWSCFLFFAVHPFSTIPHFNPVETVPGKFFPDSSSQKHKILCLENSRSQLPISKNTSPELKNQIH
jgi:hypothetical protein